MTKCYDFTWFFCENHFSVRHFRNSFSQNDSGNLRDYMKARTIETELSDTCINVAECLDRLELSPA